MKQRLADRAGAHILLHDASASTVPARAAGVSSDAESYTHGRHEMVRRKTRKSVAWMATQEDLWFHSPHPCIRKAAECVTHAKLKTQLKTPNTAPGTLLEQVAGRCTCAPASIAQNLRMRTLRPRPSEPTLFPK